MKGDKAGMVPIMTNSESVKQFGNNAYGKPATALNILRETVMGRELFDYAFKEYARRWAFKHPTPADLFRTMEDASATDLDWFWRGWFFTTDNCDIALNNVKWYKVSSKDPNVEKSIQQKLDEAENPGVSRLRNDSLIEETVVERVEDANDFYNSYDPYAVDQLDEEVYENYINKLSEEEVALLDTNINYYELEFELVGGLVMPVILEFEFVDGTTQYVNIPAEIWKMGDQKVTKIFSFDKEVVRVVLDPLLETADTDRNNNYWPPRMEPTRFEVFKLQNYGRYGRQGENPMQRVKRIQEMNASEAAPAE